MQCMDSPYGIGKSESRASIEHTIDFTQAGPHVVPTP